MSAREAEVLGLVAEGLTDQEVAQRLYLSPRTVGQHLRSVYRKLGVRSRTAATREAIERGLILEHFSTSALQHVQLANAEPMLKC